MVRVRIAPSPTGNFHIGTARTAIFNALFARKENGKFVLRIDDTDNERSKPEFEEDIIESLTWLGIQWDEGPIRQSERTEHYKKHLKQLLDQDKAYFCFCSKDKLEKDRKEQKKKKLAPHYAGHCASLSQKEQQDLLAKNKEHVIRFRTPKSITIEFDDIIRNRVCFSSDEYDDFVIAKNIEESLYNFTVVIDDQLMKISHVIRGEDHISNTPKQILLEQALDFSTPQFAHLPLIVDSNRAKLSKRKSGVSVRDFRAQGLLPEALVNYLILLGWHPRGNEEMFSFEQAAEEFDLKRVQKSSATWDENKLMWLNGRYLRSLPGSELLERSIPYLVDTGLIFQKDDGNIGNQKTGESLDKVKLAAAAELIKSRIKLLGDVPEMLSFVFPSDYKASLLLWEKETKANTKKYLKQAREMLGGIQEKSWDEEVLRGTFFKYLDEKRVARSNMLWPIRVALSSKKSSPGTFELLSYLGKSESIKRLNKALEKLG